MGVEKVSAEIVCKDVDATTETNRILEPFRQSLQQARKRTFYTLIVTCLFSLVLITLCITALVWTTIDTYEPPELLPDLEKTPWCVLDPRIVSNIMRSCRINATLSKMVSSRDPNQLYDCDDTNSMQPIERCDSWRSSDVECQSVTNGWIGNSMPMDTIWWPRETSYVIIEDFQRLLIDSTDCRLSVP